MAFTAFNLCHTVIKKKYKIKIKKTVMKKKQVAFTAKIREEHEALLDNYSLVLIKNPGICGISKKSMCLS